MLLQLRARFLRPSRLLLNVSSRQASNSIMKDTFARRVGSDYKETHIKHNAIDGKLTISAPFNALVTPGRSRESVETRVYLKPYKSIVGRANLKVYWQLPENIFTKLKESQDELSLTICNHRSTSARYMTNLMKKSDQFERKQYEDGTVYVTSHSFLEAPALAGDYVVRLCKDKKEALYHQDKSDSRNASIELKKHFTVLAVSPVFTIRVNFLGELITSLTQSHKESVLFSVSRLLKLMETIVQEKKLICLLNGVTLNSKNVVSMSWHTPKELEIMHLRNKNGLVPLREVDLDKFDTSDKLKLLEVSLLQCAEYVLHTADMMLTYQNPGIWIPWSELRVDNNDLKTRYENIRISPTLARLIEVMLSSPVLQSVLQNSTIAASKVAGALEMEDLSVKKRLDITSLINKIENVSDTNHNKRSRQQTSDLSVLPVLNKVVDVKSLTDVNLSMDGPTMLLRLHQLRAAYDHTLYKFLPREFNIRYKAYLERYGFVVDRYDAHSINSLEQCGQAVSDVLSSRVNQLKLPMNEQEKRQIYLKTLQERLCEAVPSLSGRYSFTLYYLSWINWVK